MPATRVVFFRDGGGGAPVLEWLSAVRARDPRGYAKCRVRIGRLAEVGHELRRPDADTLRDGVHELRVRAGRVNYRVLYGFHGRTLAVLAHALTKEDAVPDRDIDAARERLAVFATNPGRHTYVEDEEEPGR